MKEDTRSLDRSSCNPTPWVLVESSRSLHINVQPSPTSSWKMLEKQIETIGIMRFIWGHMRVSMLYIYIHIYINAPQKRPHSRVERLLILHSFISKAKHRRSS